MEQSISRNPIDALPTAQQPFVTQYVERVKTIPSVRSVGVASLDKDMVLVVTKIVSKDETEQDGISDAQYYISHLNGSPDFAFVESCGESPAENLDVDRYLRQGLTPVIIFQREA